MLTVGNYGKIRIAHRDGMSMRQIARRFGHSRRKIREALQESEPRPYTVPPERPAPRLGPYKAWIEQILVQDQQAPRKQRHTAATRPYTQRAAVGISARETAKKGVAKDAGR